MKKVLLIASIIGLFMATTMDLQARSRRNDLSRNARSGISSGQSRQAPSLNRNNSYSQYGNRQGRNVRGGISVGSSRYAPSRDRSNSYSQYGNRSNSYSQYGNRSNSYSRYGNRYNNYSRYNNYPGRYARGGISLGLFLGAPSYNRYNNYGQYYNYSGRTVASEIRSNEERIWNLEQRIDSLYRYGDNYGEIRELEQEINWLERRNDDLRNRRY